MDDWRERYTNCHDCAEYQDNKEPTELCNKCLCYDCGFKRSNCLKRSWCSREQIEIEILTKLI